MLLYRKIRERLGLRLLRCAYTGGTATGPEVYAFYHMIGIDMRQLYSLTEIGGIGFGQYPGQSNPEGTGKPFPGVELKLSESEQILIYAPYFAGYYNDTESGAAVCKNGWLSTGDRGFIDDGGYVFVLGRHAETIETTTGHKVQPELIENRLKFSPYIKEAIAVGRARPYVSALIQIDRESVGAWAQRRGIPYTTFRDLAAKPEVIELIGQAVENVNERLDEPGRIRRYDLLQKELDPDDGELTRTRKLRRGFIEARYKNLIDSMYTPQG
jgi:long-chain acyl-CoA synthetase